MCCEVQSGTKTRLALQPADSCQFNTVKLHISALISAMFHAVEGSVQQLAVKDQALKHQAKAGIAADRFSCHSNTA